MKINGQAQKPFRFYTRKNLSEMTALRAFNLNQLLELIKVVPEACIYHHTHRFLQQHQYLCPEPPNDFAYWVGSFLGEDELGESLASIDTIQFSNIRDLRGKIIKTLEEHLKHRPSAKLRFVTEGEEFHFIKAISFILPTPYLANNLREFKEILKKVTIDSIYFHIFEARLRLEKKANDFSYWIETYIGNKQLSHRISNLDPYTHTLEDLRRTIVKLIEQRSFV